MKKFDAISIPNYEVVEKFFNKELWKDEKTSGKNKKLVSKASK